jgi:hypothetical protein
MRLSIVLVIPIGRVVHLHENAAVFTSTHQQYIFYFTIQWHDRLLTRIGGKLRLDTREH